MAVTGRAQLAEPDNMYSLEENKVEMPSFLLTPKRKTAKSKKKKADSQIAADGDSSEQPMFSESSIALAGSLASESEPNNYSNEELQVNPPDSSSYDADLAAEQSNAYESGQNMYSAEEFQLPSNQQEPKHPSAGDPYDV